MAAKAKKGKGNIQGTHKQAAGKPSVLAGIPKDHCRICGSKNVHYNRERAELICRSCGEIQMQIV